MLNGVGIFYFLMKGRKVIHKLHFSSIVVYAAAVVYQAIRDDDVRSSVDMIISANLIKNRLS